MYTSQTAGVLTANLKAVSPETHLNNCYRADLPGVVIKDYSINNTLVLTQKKSQRTVDKGLFVPAHIQAYIAQIHWFDLGQVLQWLESLIAPLSLRVQTHCAQEGFLHSFYSRVFRSTSVLTVLYDHVST